MGFYGTVDLLIAIMLREYLEISRLFNMGLTGVAPVLGALAMWNIGRTTLLEVFVLFVIGCLSHIYGFVLNDIMDIGVDKLSKELTARPLVSGTITVRKAAVFAILCMVISWFLALIFFQGFSHFFILMSILVLAYVFATVYDIASKKYPGMDIFVSGAVFFLIIFGAYTIGTPTTLAWIVAFVGGIQVLFMNMINGAIKDVDHDKKGMANTIAIRLGAHIQGEKVLLPTMFKGLGYLIELVRSGLIFAPFVFFILPFELWQLMLLVVLTVLTFYSIYKLFSIRHFERSRIRKYIGVIVIFMYATAPVMLSSLNLYILLVAFIPPLWFIVSNVVLHKTFLEPQTM